MPHTVVNKRTGTRYTAYTNRELDRCKGHKRTVEKLGAESGFYSVACECGWSSGGLVNRRHEIIARHRAHVERELDKLLEENDND